MKRIQIEIAREDLRLWAVNHTKCSAQNGWPCGTCFCNLLEELGASEDGEHNEPIDRVNEVWRAVLQVRGYVELEPARPT